MTTQDFYPVHKWIGDHFFEGHAWVYNGAATDVAFISGTTGKVYVCRARDMRPGKHAQSHVAIQHFDDEWKAMSSPRLLPITAADNSKLKMDTGPQDARIFIFRGDVWIVFNMLCADGFRRIHIYNVTGDHGRDVIPLRVDGSDRSKTEKNWTPFVFNNELFFIYYFAPLVILRCDVKTGFCRVVYSNSTERRPELRGGSPALQMADDRTHFFGYLHTTTFLPKRHEFEADELPIPAKATAHLYRARRFDLTFGKPGLPPKLRIGDEIAFTGKQIEQIYGIGLGGWGIVNVNDRQTVVKTPLVSPKKLEG